MDGLILGDKSNYLCTAFNAQAYEGILAAPDRLSRFDADMNGQDTDINLQYANERASKNEFKPDEDLFRNLSGLDIHHITPVDADSLDLSDIMNAVENLGKSLQQEDIGHPDVQAASAVLAEAVQLGENELAPIVRNFSDGLSQGHDLTIVSVQLAGSLYNLRTNHAAAFGDHTITFSNNAADQFMHSTYTEADRQQMVPLPCRNELWEFLAALHESEHLFSKNESVAPGKVDASLDLDPVSFVNAMNAQNSAAHGVLEVSADLAVIDYLDQSKEPEMQFVKQAWLDERMIESFKFGVLGIVSDHDTATFINVYKETGEQLNMARFLQAKKSLTDLIGEEMGISNEVLLRRSESGRTAYPDISKLMGATQSVLDSNPALSEMQRAEANEFLRAAGRRGFSPSQNYHYNSKPGIHKPDIHFHEEDNAIQGAALEKEFKPIG